jgi:trans-2,3-dihydro-3-hydroxyanthranilate isomerase
MRTLNYHLINVFAESPLQGNPVCVFEDGSGLSDAEMQSLALQFNLSETTFILPSETATKRMRIFTTTFEMPFAGHPTLGTSHVVRRLGNTGDSISLETKAGVVPVTASGDRWTLQIPNKPVIRKFPHSQATLADVLGLDEADIIGHPLYIDTGSDQFIVPLASREAVMRCSPNVAKLAAAVKTSAGRYMAYVFAMEDEAIGENKIVSRSFFPNGNAMVEDPGTGSACANLGGYLLAQGKRAPFTLSIDQGERTGRRCALTLSVDENERIHVGGRCVRIGGGTIELP